YALTSTLIHARTYIDSYVLTYILIHALTYIDSYVLTEILPRTNLYTHFPHCPYCDT
ncbi:hypothetical protein B484DRAFT_342003, partial [Ochromonadaceae sp. CCMP2298]